jgi:hypothetical protein
VTYQDDKLKTTAEAEVGGSWLKGFSQVNYISGMASGRASSHSQTKIIFEVLSEGQVSFDWLLKGELKLVDEIYNYPSEYFSAQYDFNICDNVSLDAVQVSEMLQQYKSGTSVKTISETQKYKFGENSLSAGTLVEVDLDLNTATAAGYGYGSGTQATSDFSHTLSISNLTNLRIVPEPISLFFMGGALAALGIRRLKK